jgi:copper chaperone CopZ
MKRFALLMIVAAFTLFASGQAFAGEGKGCSKTCPSFKTCAGKTTAGDGSASVVEAMKAENSKVLFLSVDKMKDDDAAAGVSKALTGLDGVTAVDVNRKKGTATVVFASDKLKTDDIVASVSKAGYSAKMKDDCCKEMKKLCGDKAGDKCAKSCANECKGKSEKKSDS